VRRDRLLLAAAALWASACTPPASGPSQPPATVTDTAITAVSVERASDAPGPVDAAVQYVASTDSLVAHSAVGRQELLRRMVAPDALAEHAEALESAIADMATRLDVPVERLTWVEAPITASVASVAGTAVSVDVWTVSILGAPEVGSPQEVWRTVHVDLEQVDEGWLVAAATADAGPTPAANELALQAGWSDFEAVASWPPVVEGEEL